MTYEYEAFNCGWEEYVPSFAVFEHQIAHGFVWAALAVPDETERVELLIDGMEELTTIASHVRSAYSAEAALWALRKPLRALQTNFLRTTTIEREHLAELHQRLVGLARPRETEAVRLYLWELAGPEFDDRNGFMERMTPPVSILERDEAFSAALERCEDSTSCWRFERELPPPPWGVTRFLRGPASGQARRVAWGASDLERWAAERVERYLVATRILTLATEVANGVLELRTKSIEGVNLVDTSLLFVCGIDVAP